MHKIKVFYNEIDGAKKKIQQALILVRLTELNKGRIEKPQKRLHSKKWPFSRIVFKDKIK